MMKFTTLSFLDFSSSLFWRLEQSSFFKPKAIFPVQEIATSCTFAEGLKVSAKKTQKTESSLQEYQEARENSP